jgi:TonB family protein
MRSADFLELRVREESLMKKPIESTCLKIVFIFFSVVPAQAQIVTQNREQSCQGPVFSSRELSHPATITSRQIPAMTQEALDHDVHGRVVLEAVLCRTGRITDLRVVESLPYGMTEKAVESVRKIEFTPAEMNWHSVSQKIRFESSFNEEGLDEISAKDAEGRMIGTVEIIGNRRLTAKEILDLIQTRPGDLFSAQQVKADLAAILASGYFNSKGTRVQLENSKDGGVVVVFEVQELPPISAVKFEGLEGVAESVIVEALRKDQTDVLVGQVYDPLKVRNATSIIRKVLASRGQRNVNVEALTEQLTAGSVALTFLISRK